MKIKKFGSFSTWLAVIIKYYIKSVKLNFEYYVIVIKIFFKIKLNFPEVILFVFQLNVFILFERGVRD